MRYAAKIPTPSARTRVFRASQNRHRGGELRPKPSARFDARLRQETPRLPYTVTAIRDDEKMQSVRNSALIALAKARVWESEGWRVSIDGPDGRKHAVAQLDAITSFKPEKWKAFAAIVPAQDALSDTSALDLLGSDLLDSGPTLQPDELQGPWMSYGPLRVESRSAAAANGLALESS
ncbi:hypothetical protein LPW26_11905 [Rhodopseudomonas sp. HC1]|uniref:hypothetical protein n=1 Tax=Rhodopseudomonas infernalis TaxID=2897386 RepID=UPI001EE8352F|nr:hypothetical protein [Rhodopseudomonas infernalis]MCG6205347.1 hypothetical protein [Rhodopseudomonas infernalis]